MNRENLILLGIFIALLVLSEKPFGTACVENYLGQHSSFETIPFTCESKYGCRYEITTCQEGSGFYARPAKTGTLGEDQQVEFSCSKIGTGETSYRQVTVKLWETDCQQIGNIQIILPTKGYYTTDMDVEVEVNVIGGTHGEYIYGKIGTLETYGTNLYGTARLNFNRLPRDFYTVEVWREGGVDQISQSFQVKGVIDASYSFEPIQAYNNVNGFIYLKDENGLGLSPYEISVYDLKVYSKIGLQEYPFTSTYKGKTEISGGTWEVSGNTNRYIGEIVFDFTIKKTDYEDKYVTWQVTTFIPSLDVVTKCEDFDCPFPNSATLMDTKEFTFYTQLADGTKVDAFDYLKVTSPSRKIVDYDITSSVSKTGTGVYYFKYGPFDEVEAYTFEIHAKFLGQDPVTVKPKVAVGKEEEPKFPWQWLLVLAIPLAIIYFMWGKKR